MKYLFFALTSLLIIQAIDAQPVFYDLLIKNGRIVDGTGSPWYAADLAIKDGKIAAIGKMTQANARQTIDASGLVVSPGFIDLMGQTAAPFLRDPNVAISHLSQGITTINAGEGDSDAPLNDDQARLQGWKTMREYLFKLNAAGMPMNMTQTVGHTQIRSIVIGDKDQEATPAQMDQMRDLVKEAMEAGAIGLSTSLIYPPAIYGSEQEITELTKVAGRYGGRYFTHMRNEGDRLLEAIDEALRIGAIANTPVHIYHLKTAGQSNWGKMDQALSLIKAARARGQEVGVDIYPYINNGLGIRAMLHPRHSAEGYKPLLAKLKDPGVRAEMRKEMESLSGWENWYAHIGKDWNRLIVANLGATPYAAYNGQSLATISTAAGKSPWDLFFELCLLEEVFAAPQSMSEANKIKAMLEEFTSFDTDAGPTLPKDASKEVMEGIGPGHPRAFGAFPRVLARYVRDLGVLSLEGAIHRMTAVAANEIMAYDRGRLSPGLAADIAIFDFSKIQDKASFQSPTSLSVGMEWVIVNGVVVYTNGKYTGAKPGRVIRGPGYYRP